MFIGRYSCDVEYPAKYQGMLQGDVISDVKVDFYENEILKIYFWGVLYNKKIIEGEVVNDAQYVARLYDKSIEVFADLDGSFVCVLAFKDKTFMVIRDHHGTYSPVYYNDKYFASSLSLLQQTEGCSKEPDYGSLNSFLSIGYIATPFSSFKGVRKLAAGHVLLIDKEGMNSYPLFHDTLSIPQTRKNLEILSEEYGKLHADAIRRRIGNSRNVGILLSGGYDSGCNLAALRQIYDGEINSFSIGFKGDDWSELPLARCMSEVFQTNHHEYEIDGSEIIHLPEIVSFLGDPFVEGGLMVNYSVMRMIGNPKPDIILGGDGSDQYFGTSGREIALHYLVSRYGMKPVLKCIYKLLSRDHFESDTKLYRLRFHLDKVLNILDGDLFGFPFFMLEDMLQNDEKPIVKADSLPDLHSFEHLYLQHAYKSDIEKIINQVILFKASAMASMFGNHIAFPYLDHTLYQFLQQLPVEFKCRGNSIMDIAKGHFESKFLLKYHYKSMLPEMITAKKKQGGFAPMPIFFRDKIQRAALAEFILLSSVVTDYLQRNKVEEFIRKYDNEADEHGNWFWYRQNKAIQYFNLLTLAIWWEIFVKGREVKLI